MSKKKLLFVYDYFFPGYKAGGPIQSLTNLALFLQPRYDIYVITGACDLQSEVPYPEVQANQWNKILLPGSSCYTSIWYNDKKGPSKQKLRALIKETAPDRIYLNGVFSLRYFLLPVIATKSLGLDRHVVICPRGMLQKGALGGKSFKKKVYLALIRMTGLVKNAKWHATNLEEMEDIHLHFPKHDKIVIAENIPKIPIDTITFPLKKPNELKLIYLSLIAEKKNLYLLMQAVGRVKTDVSLHVYGPPKDIDYWHKCEELIKTIPGRLAYLGDVKPVDVQQVISAAQVFVLPTKGENFGHAIYESLSVGRPVITSHFTPWNDLQQKKAGINVDIASDEDIIKAIEKFKAMDQLEYNEYCIGAYQLAGNYYDNMDWETKYEELFKS